MLDVKAPTSEDQIHGRPAPISNFPMLLTSGICIENSAFQIVFLNTFYFCCDL